MYAFNPYLPSFEYIPDAEPHVFGDRVYIYGSHDKFNGYAFCLNDYVCWSAPVDDLSDWRYEGVIYKRSQDPRGKKGFQNALYAPDVCKGSDGRFYMYYFLANHGIISVAVCDSPNGKYEYLGDVKYSDGKILGSKKEPLQFDPGVFIDDDGKIYLYTGFAPLGWPDFLMSGHKATEHGAMGFELEPDMLTIKSGIHYIGVEGQKNSQGTDYEGHEFFEASSMRKRDGKYYFIYSTVNGHELAYAVSDNPLSGFNYGGVIISNGDLGLSDEMLNYTGNIHGSIENINGQEYVFYHRQTNRNMFSRQACAEKIEIKDGKIPQVEMTSCGLNCGDLGKGTIGAYTACNLYSKRGAYHYSFLRRPKGIHPYFTQSGKDREDNSDQYIRNLADGSTAVFKYFTFDTAKHLILNIKAHGNGRIKVYCDEKQLCELPIQKGDKKACSNICFKASHSAIKFVYEGKKSVDFIDFTIE